MSASIGRERACCGDFLDGPECCSSCHDQQRYADEHGGFCALVEVYGGDVEALVCCAKAVWLKRRGWSYHPEPGTAHA